MNVLAVETSQSACSVAVRVAGELAGHRTVEAGKGHAEVLFLLAARALAEAGLGYANLNLLAASVGPGLFTGVRVGLAAVRGLRLALKVPALGVGTLHAIAAAAAAAQLAKGDEEIVVANDARRDEVYVQRFDARARPIGEVALLPRAQVALLTAPAVLVGSATDLLGVLRPAVRVIKGYEQADAAFVALVAEQAARLTGFRDPGPPRPLYVRPPHVKLPTDIAG